jgi:hypothetical protein
MKSIRPHRIMTAVACLLVLGFLALGTSTPASAEQTTPTLSPDITYLLATTTMPTLSPDITYPLATTTTTSPPAVTGGAGTTGAVTTLPATTVPEAVGTGGIASGWIALIVVVAVVVLLAMGMMVYTLGKKSKGGPSA